MTVFLVVGFALKYLQDRHNVRAHGAQLLWREHLLKLHVAAARDERRRQRLRLRACGSEDYEKYGDVFVHLLRAVCLVI